MTTALQTRPLQPRFGVEILDVDIRDVTADHLYPEIRELFEAHSLLLFRNQQMDEDVHNDFALLFGPLEDRIADAAQSNPDPRPSIPRLTNLTTNGDRVRDQSSIQVKNMIANQFWHTDSTFLNTPALINVITAFVVPSEGGETELVSTRAAFEDLPAEQQEKLIQTDFLHSLLRSRIRVDPELLRLPEVSRYQSKAWRAVWPNPVNGKLALYIAEHVYQVRGMEPQASIDYMNELIDYCTQEEYRYRHCWQPGDVLVWDERATMHRGRPWPYDQERTLASCCVSAREIDGLAQVRPLGGEVQPGEKFNPV